MNNVHECKQEATCANDDFNVYKVQMYVKCTEEDAVSLSKYLAQTVFDGFEFDKENAVFDVKVELGDQS